MNKARRKVDRFVNHLFGAYKVPKIPVRLHWHHDSIVGGDGRWGFGMFVYDHGTTPSIHVACKQIGKTGVLSVVAHEFVHYLQYLHGRIDEEEDAERDAEYWSVRLLGMWLIGYTPSAPLEVWREAEDEN